MDREKFDQHLMDYLFDELDEVTRAAMKRKLDADAECREVEAKLRATLDVARLPMEKPSEDLEDRILAAAHVAQRGEPWHRKLLRSLSWAGSHAMRPQLAMAAVLVLLLGSSVLLLRAPRGAMRVSTEGPPGKDPAAVPVAAGTAQATATSFAESEQKPAPRDNRPLAAASDATAAPAAAASAGEALAANEAIDGKSDETYDRAMKNFRAGNNADAQRDFAAVSSAGGKNAPMASLYLARSVRAGSGCQAALGHYDKVRQRFGNAGVGADATFEQADCYRQLGDRPRARQLLLALADNPEYKARAADELDRAGEAASTGGNAVAAPKRAAPPNASPPAAPPATSPNAAKQSAF